jgi:hypothetical protein
LKNGGWEGKGKGDYWKGNINLEIMKDRTVK